MFFLREKVVYTCTVISSLCKLQSCFLYVIISWFFSRSWFVITFWDQIVTSLKSQWHEKYFQKNLSRGFIQKKWKIRHLFLQKVPLLLWQRSSSTESKCYWYEKLRISFFQIQKYTKEMYKYVFLTGHYNHKSEHYSKFKESHYVFIVNSCTWSWSWSCKFFVTRNFAYEINVFSF